MLRGLARTLLLALALTLAAAATTLAADPSPAVTPGPSPVLIDPLDPRAGAGANSVGAPLLALVGVIGAGLVAAAATYVYATRLRRG